MKSSPPSVPSPAGGSGLARRDFGKLVGLAGVGAFFSRQPVMAGPFARADFHTLVPEDKKLTADWIASLTARGAPEVLRGENLRWVGMPVGGLCTGQLYLGGDGRLWHWDIFNQHQGTGAGHYASPPAPTAPLEQGFAVRVGDQVRTLDRTGFPAVTFRGEYPIGRVQYQADGFPVEIALEAFSPYIPLNTEDSSLPATVLSFTVKNTSAAPVEAELGGWLQNAVCLHSGPTGGVARRNRVKRTPARTTLLCTAESPEGPVVAARPDIVFENFEQETYVGWTVEGTTFGAGPVAKAKIPEYQGEVGGEGKRVVNSHATGPGAEVGARDAGRGKLTSREFVIERNFISFFIGGGSHAGKTCLNLVVGGKVAQSATGRDHNTMRRESLDVRKLAGQKARIEIVDAQEGGWGNIGVDHIVFSDVAAASAPLAERSDYGSLALALLDPQPTDAAQAALPGANLAAQLFPVAADGEQGVVKPEGEKLVGALARKLALASGASATVTFILAWHFPNLAIKGVPSRGRYYASKFASADAVADYLATHFARLAAQTRLWRDTWYDSTLPYWLLDARSSSTTPSPPPHLPPLRQRPLLRLGGHRLLRRHLRARLAIRPGPGPHVPVAGAVRARDGRLRLAFNADTGAIHYPRRGPQDRRHRRPVRHHPPRYREHHGVPDDAFLATHLAQGEEGHRLPDREGQGLATACSRARSTTPSIPTGSGPWPG
jgi:non-lysosomal glucosylceramidase